MVRLGEDARLAMTLCDVATRSGRPRSAAARAVSSHPEPLPAGTSSRPGPGRLAGGRRAISPAFRRSPNAPYPDQGQAPAPGLTARSRPPHPIGPPAAVLSSAGPRDARTKAAAITGVSRDLRSCGFTEEAKSTDIARGRRSGCLSYPHRASSSPARTPRATLGTRLCLRVLRGPRTRRSACAYNDLSVRRRWPRRPSRDRA